MGVRLPQELIEAIIDHLHDDWSFLSASSLTCRDWLPRSRHHKFAHVKFRADCGRKSFLSCPIAAEYALQVTMEGDIMVDPTYIDIKCCTKLQRLSFRRINFVVLMPSLYSCTTVTNLELSRCRFPHTTDIFRLLWSFPNLSSLALLNNVCLRIDNVVIPAIVTPPPFSGHLRIAAYREEFTRLSQVLLSLHSRIPFRSIEIDLIDLWVEPLNVLLTACGPSLHTLSSNALQLENFIGHGTPPVIDLSNNPNLRRICLPCTRNDDLDAYRILSTITSPFVEEIHLTFETPIMHAFEDFQWDPIDALLSTPRFSNLRKFRMTFVRLGRLRRTLAGVLPRADTLPRLAARGFLEIIDENQDG